MVMSIANLEDNDSLGHATSGHIAANSSTCPQHHTASLSQKLSEASATSHFAPERIGQLEPTARQQHSLIKRFQPDLIETARRHGGGTCSETQPLPDRSSSHSLRRFTPQLIDTNRKIRRKFEPQLVETVKRSRRYGDIHPALTPADRTDAVPCRDTVLQRRRHTAKIPSPAKTPLFLPNSASMTTKEARRRGIALPKRCLSSSSGQMHRHYKSPNLETIESSDSEHSDSESPASTQPISLLSGICSSDRLSGTANHRPTGRLLAVAAANAERQLKARALAAFPNDDSHQTIQHYVDPDFTPNLSSYSTMYEVTTSRYQSTNWDLIELREHHRRLELERQQEQRKREARRRLHRHLDENLDENPWDVPVFSKRHSHTTKKDKRLATLNLPGRVKPPMLGKDIEFPRSASPEMARFDITQGSESLKRQMCYLSAQSHQPRPSWSGLWSPKKSAELSSVQWSRPTSRAPSTGVSGLWGGACIDTGVTVLQRPSGLITPRVGDDVGFIPSTSVNLLPCQLPPSPPISSSDAAQLPDTAADISIEDEFDDHFVTQVYNYISLGYSAIACDYDEELSRITHIPVEQLRQDANISSSRGYIRLGEDAASCDGVTEQNCARWKALRIYINEWARQQSRIGKHSAPDSPWPIARKSSWSC